jgi:endogenous inhibitor of DNA gyrase (YacG/DUF329 family)
MTADREPDDCGPPGWRERFREGVAARDAERERQRLAERSRDAKCVTCGAAFVSLRAPNYRWPKTCSAYCQLVKLDHFIAVLQARRAVVAELEAAERRRRQRR